MDLYYTAGRIAKIENESKMSYLLLIEKVSLENIALFVKHGLGVSKDEAFVEIDKYLKDEGKDIIQLFADEVVGALSKSGFLPKVLDKEVKEEMSQKISENLKTSRSIGEV
jgi:hypothetical protein